jgi:hypothetical protein
MLLAAFLAFNPVSIGIIGVAFFSGEALALDFWGPIALTGMAAMALIVLLEWRIRTFMLNRRARGATIT